jgi:hypothetical protein
MEWPTFFKEDHLSHFVRGCWDGDGSIITPPSGLNTLRLQYACGSPSFTKGMINVISRVIEDEIYCRKTKGFLLYVGGDNAEKLGTWMYAGSREENRMTRKHTLFTAICERRTEKRLEAYRTTRLCSGCQTVHPLSNDFFHRSKAHRGGYVYVCKKCVSARAKVRSQQRNG